MVDEGHDFAPEWLKLVAQMVNPATDSLLVLYDDAQNLYSKQTSRQFSFKGLGIKAQGRTTILKLNYRNTAQVLMLAYEFAKEMMPPRICQTWLAKLSRIVIKAITPPSAFTQAT